MLDQVIFEQINFKAKECRKNFETTSPPTYLYYFVSKTWKIICGNNFDCIDASKDIYFNNEYQFLLIGLLRTETDISIELSNVIKNSHVIIGKVEWKK